jgi:IS5 family transposase
MDLIGTSRTIGMHSPTITHEHMTPEKRAKAAAILNPQAQQGADARRAHRPAAPQRTALRRGCCPTALRTIIPV